MGKRTRKELKVLKIDALHDYIESKFRLFTDNRSSTKSIKLSDALMSGYAMFSLKDSSLLSFDKERESRKENLKMIYKIDQAPGDSGLRQILDEVDWEEFDGVFRGIFSQAKSVASYKTIGK